MDNAKIGKIIKKLRLEKCLTQKELADKLCVTDKAVSKWERGLGAPELSLIADLSANLGINILNLLTADMNEKENFIGNMKNTKIYFCPSCKTITTSSGNAEISCCGKTLVPCEFVKPDKEHDVNVEVIEEDWHIYSEHPMEKEHSISFALFLTGDKLQLIKQYPEWNFDTRIQKRGHGKLLWYCTNHGGFYKLI